MKLTYLFDSVWLTYLTNIFRDFAHDGTSNTYWIHDKGKLYLQSSIRLHGTSNRKFSHWNRFILQKNSPAFIEQMLFFENTEMLRRDV
jgi:hypothetical protein